MSQKAELAREGHKRQISCARKVQLAWLFKDLLLDNILLWWLISLVKRALKTHIPVLDPHFSLVTILCISLIEIIYHALLNSNLIQSFLSLSFCGINLDIYF